MLGREVQIGGADACRGVVRFDGRLHQLVEHSHGGEDHAADPDVLERGEDEVLPRRRR